MSRIFQGLRGRGSQRELILNVVVGSSTIAAYSAWLYHPRRPLLADGGSFGDQWKTKPQVNSRSNSSAAPSRQPKDAASSSITGTEGEQYDDGLQAWQATTKRITAASSSLVNFSLAGVGNKILPSWVRSLPGWLEKVQNEMSMAPWSLSWEIWEDAHNPEANPEILWDARVRLSNKLCQDEKRFLRNRQRHTAKALAKYLGVKESEVHPEDVPVIAMCGSGGGARALVAGASSYLSAAEDGLFDCVTYTAGVSGSCWLQSLYYTTIGQQNYGNIIKHIKNRLGVHIAEPTALLKLITQAPTNKYLLSGYVEKLRGVKDADFGLVDIYGLALAARLLVPKGELRVNDVDLKLSNQRAVVDSGRSPMPIYTAVRHEIPDPAGDLNAQTKSVRFTKKQFDWFQWFEWTPYEFFSEDLQAGIPTWAVGRKFDAGRTVWRDNDFALPELRIPLYLGIWGSAFCATLAHYYKEIRPIIQAAGMGGLDALVSGKSDDLSKVHPIDPAVIPNFALGLEGQLPPSCPESIHTTSHLQLMDAGMANNLPIYPLLRPGRDVDIVIAFDASADVRGDNWIKAVDEYVSQRGIKGWPMGAGWPPESNSEEQTIGELDATQVLAAEETDEAAGGKVGKKTRAAHLGYCTVWAGNTQERHEFTDHDCPHRIESDDDHELLKTADAGIAVVYFPFLANPKVPGVDPMTSDFMSTWNSVYTPDQIEDVVALARANYEAGKEQTKRTIRAVWERKRLLRQQRLEETKWKDRNQRLWRGTAAMPHGDQFGGGV